MKVVLLVINILFFCSCKSTSLPMEMDIYSINRVKYYVIILMVIFVTVITILSGNYVNGYVKRK